MYTIKYKKCVAKQNNKTFEVTVSKDGYPDICYEQTAKLSVKEMRSVINNYLANVESK